MKIFFSTFKLFPFHIFIISCEATMCTGISVEQWRVAVGVMAARAKMRHSKNLNIYLGKRLAHPLNPTRNLLSVRLAMANSRLRCMKHHEVGGHQLEGLLGSGHLRSAGSEQW